MNERLERRALKGTLAGFFLLLLTFVQTITLVPLFLKYWGTEKYGTWLAISAFITLLKTLESGHQNFVGNRFNFFFHTNFFEARKILGSGFRIGVLIGLLEIVVYLCIIFVGVENQIINIDSGTDKFIILALLLLIVIWGVTGSVGGILVKVILPLGKYSQSIYFSIVQKLGEILLLTSAIVDMWPIASVCFGLALFILGYNACLFFYIKKVMPAVFPWWKNGEWKQGMQNFYKSLFLTLNGFLEQFNTNNGIFILITNFLSKSILPVFTTQKTIVNIFTQITGLFTNPLTPDIIRYEATGEKKKIFYIFYTTWLITSLLVNLPLVLILPVINVLYNFWTKGQLLFNYDLFYCLAISVSFINFGRPLMLYLSSINHIRSLLAVSFLKGVTLFLLAILLINRSGLTGIGISILVSEIVGSVIIPAYYVSRILGRFASNKFILGISTNIVLAVTFFVSYNKSDVNRYLLCIISALLMFILLLSQWNSLPKEIKSRGKTMFRSKGQVLE